MSDLLNAFLEEIQDVKEDSIISKEQSREGMITGFKEREENSNNDSNDEPERSDFYKRVYKLATTDPAFFNNQPFDTWLYNHDINPNCVYMRPSWHIGETEYVPDRIDLEKGLIILNIRGGFHNSKTNRYEYNTVKKTAMSPEQFKKMINLPVNKKWLDKCNDTPVSIANYEYKQGLKDLAKEIAEYFDSNKDLYDLDKYDNETLKKLYHLIKNSKYFRKGSPSGFKGYTIPEALRYLEIKESTVITETKTYISFNDNPNLVRFVLEEIGINKPELGLDFTAFPIIIEGETETKDGRRLNPNQIEKTKYYLIDGIPNEYYNSREDKIDIDKVYVKDYSSYVYNTKFRPDKDEIKNIRAYPMSIEDLKIDIDKFIKRLDELNAKQNFFDKYDKMAQYIFTMTQSPNKRKIIANARRAKYCTIKPLPRDILIGVLKILDKSAMKDEWNQSVQVIDSLVDLYRDRPDSPIIKYALMEYDKDSKCKFGKMKNSSSGWGIYYPSFDEMQNKQTKVRPQYRAQNTQQNVRRGRGD